MRKLGELLHWRSMTEDEEERVEEKPDLHEKPEGDYNLKHSGVRLHNLPFSPNSNEVIYSVQAPSGELDKLIEDNLEEIKEIFAREQLRFIYLPLLWQEMRDDEALWEYQVPYGKVQLEGAAHPMYSDYLLHYMVDKTHIREVAGPGVMRSVDSSGRSYTGVSIYHRWEIVPEEIDDVERYFTYLAFTVKHERNPWGGLYNVPKADENFADAMFDEETEKLIEEVKFKIDLLRRRGVSEVYLKGLNFSTSNLSTLFFSADNRLFLTDYRNKEVVMTPLVKAVYILFLNHPEGIMFKELPDYRAELAEIYYSLKGNKPLKRRLGIKEYPQSIIDVTDPTNNSINEKCARIKEAFLKVVPDYIAEYYYITGRRGSAKKVKLPLHLLKIFGINA